MQFLLLEGCFKQDTLVATSVSRTVGWLCLCPVVVKGFELLMLATAWPLEGKNQVAENVQNNFAILQAFSKQLERSLEGVAKSTKRRVIVIF